MRRVLLGLWREAEAKWRESFKKDAANFLKRTGAAFFESGTVSVMCSDWVLLYSVATAHAVATSSQRRGKRQIF